MSFLHLDDESISLNNTIGFLFGVCKALALAQEKTETELESLKNTDAKQIAELENEIQFLRNNKRD